MGELGKLLCAPDSPAYLQYLGIGLLGTWHRFEVRGRIWHGSVGFNELIQGCV